MSQENKVSDMLNELKKMLNFKITLEGLGCIRPDPSSQGEMNTYNTAQNIANFMNDGLSELQKKYQKDLENYLTKNNQIKELLFI